MLYLLLVVAAVAVIAIIAYASQRRSRDGVASFKRQIDALSPEARKPVVDQVQSVSDLRRSAEANETASPASDDSPDDSADDSPDDSAGVDHVDPGDHDDPGDPTRGA